MLSDLKLSDVGSEIVKRRQAGDEFYLSVITHFQVMWGYRSAGLSSEKYERLLEVGEIEISALTRTDVEAAAEMKPKKSDLLDALIAASVQRYDASIWTGDRDFLSLLPKNRVRLV
ncbi:MAG TPA: PIN domain-containing protein [Nitrososphaerales archaeon]|nr:PIN domain-containing protein [Nitrososphaerales archaeon]